MRNKTFSTINEVFDNSTNKKIIKYAITDRVVGLVDPIYAQYLR